MLAVLAAFGSGLASLLPRTTDAPTRWGFAPVLGLALGAAVFTTVEWVLPARRSSWLIGLLCGVSLAIAWLRRRRAPSREDTAETAGTVGPRPVVTVAQFALVIIGAIAPATYLLVNHDSVGPVGYQVGDAQGYVATIDGMQHDSLHRALQLYGTSAYTSNIDQRYWTDLARGVQQLDVNALDANVAALIGENASETQSAFLIAFAAAGALGMFATVRAVTKRATWAAVVAGMLFGGAFFQQLYVDGSQAALSGLACVTPLLYLAYQASRLRTAASVVLAGVLLTGLAEIYPLFVPAVVIGMAASVTYLAIGPRVVKRVRRRGEFAGSREDRPLRARQIAVGAALFAVVCGAAGPVGWSRAIHYWLGVLHGQFGPGGLPDYNFLSLSTLPTWLLQLRPFYQLQSPHLRVVEALVLVLATAVCLYAIWRQPFARLLALVAFSAVVLGVYERTANSCSYCQERNVLPVAPLVIAILCIGLAEVARSTLALRSANSVPIAAALLVPIGLAASSSVAGFDANAYFLSPNIREVLAHLPAGARVDLEGFNEAPNAVDEQGFVYALAEERSWGAVSLPADFNENYSLDYLGGGSLPLTYPQFQPNYEYVLTRYPSVTTGRRTVSRLQGVALQRRVGRLDVTTDYGLSVPSVAAATSGLPSLNYYVSEPVKWLVVGAPRHTASVHAVFLLHSTYVKTSSPERQPLVVHQSGATLSICLDASGSGNVRSALLDLVSGNYAELLGVTASPRSCPTR